MARDGEFSKFVTEFGTKDKSTKKDGEIPDGVDVIENAKARLEQNATSTGMMQVGCFLSGGY
jgi:hypothetical protein